MAEEGWPRAESFEGSRTSVVRDEGEAEGGLPRLRSLEEVVDNGGGICAFAPLVFGRALGGGAAVTAAHGA